MFCTEHQRQNRLCADYYDLGILIDVLCHIILCNIILCSAITCPLLYHLVARFVSRGKKTVAGTRDFFFASKRLWSIYLPFFVIQVLGKSEVWLCPLMSI